MDKYRIIKLTNEDGSGQYLAQERLFFIFWKNIEFYYATKKGCFLASEGAGYTPYTHPRTDTSPVDGDS